MRLVLALLVLSAGCTAVSVERRGESRYAPSNERSGGSVHYLANGAPFLMKARRENAYREMYRTCGGRYSIVTEGDVATGSVSTANATAYGNSAFGTSSTYAVAQHVIDFECDGRGRRDEPSPESEADTAPVRLRQDDVPPPPPPARPITDSAIQARIGTKLNCPPSSVRIDRMAWLGATQVAYRVTANGSPFTCLEDGAALSCAPIATTASVTP